MEKKRINFEVTEEQHRQLKTLAAQQGKSIKDIILEALAKLIPQWSNK